MQSWRPFLSSTANKLHSFKGYLASKDPRQLSPASPCRVDGGPSNPGNDLGSATKQTWTQWAGEKLKRNNQSQGDNTNVETVLLFPGWAARRLHQPSSGGGTGISCIQVLPILNACSRHPFRCGGLCGRVRFEAQQSRVNVAVTENVPEVGKGCAPTKTRHFT